MAAYQGSTNRTSRAAPTVQQQQQQQQQFAMPRLEDKLIIYGDGLVFGGGPHADPFRSMPHATAAPFAQRLPVQENNSFTGLPNSSMNNLVPQQRMQQQQPWQQQQQQQQQRQQQRQQPYTPTNGARISRNGLNQLPQQQQLQQQQRPLQQQPLQHSMQQQQPQQLVQQQQPQQQPQQQQLQQAYNYWPFGGVAQTNNPNGFGYSQNHAWPGYSVMNPVNPNWTYTFG